MKLLKLLLRSYLSMWESLYDEFYECDRTGFWLIGSLIALITALALFLLVVIIHDFTIPFIIIYFVLSYLYNKVSEEGLGKHKPKYLKFKDWLNK